MRSPPVSSILTLFSLLADFSFDICFLNDIAVANSSLLREYSLIDDSVREIMVVVKKWAKDNKVCAAQDNTLSSYAWLNMVVFYLQCLGFVPNLQCPNLMEQVGYKRDSQNYWHNVNDLDTCYLTFEQVSKVWKQPEQFSSKTISNTALLYGFFHFYSIGFDRSVSMISVKRGKDEILPKTVFRKCSPFFCIEDPFETFDSHMPHDLGIPVNEPQTRRIFDLLQGAEEHLRAHLLAQRDEDVEDMAALWPWPPVESEQDKEKGKQGHNGGRGKRGGRGRGRGATRNKNNNSSNGKDSNKQQKANPQKKAAQKWSAAPAASGKGGGNNQQKQKEQKENNKQKTGKGDTQEAGQNPSEKQGGGKQKHGKAKKNAQDSQSNPQGGRGGGPNKGKHGGRGGGRRRGGRGGGADKKPTAQV